jgi:hypothetical protein
MTYRDYLRRHTVNVGGRMPSDTGAGYRWDLHRLSPTHVIGRLRGPPIDYFARRRAEVRTGLRVLALGSQFCAPVRYALITRTWCAHTRGYPAGVLP